MNEIEEIIVNDTMNKIRRLITEVKRWRADNSHCNPRETQMVLDKLTEAELWASRMVNHEKE